MAFAFIAALAHGWLHDAHAANAHFAGDSEFCTLDKTTALAPTAPEPPPPPPTVVTYASLTTTTLVGLHRNHAQARAPPCS